MIYIAGQTALAGNVKGLFTTKIDRNWFITIITVLVTILTHNLSIGTVIGTLAHYGLPGKSS